MRSVLFCFAHPDDESFSGVGTAMACAEMGVRTVLVTATRGGRGKRGDPPLCSEAELPAVRERELRQAARIAAFDELHLLDYRDRELAEAPPADLRAMLVGHIRRVRPLVVLTFDPNGFNLHPDHMAISRFTSEAIGAAADARWVPEAGEPYEVPRLLWTPPLPPWEAVGRDCRLEPGADFAIDVARFRDRRIAALRAHRTQHLSIDAHFFQHPQLDRMLAVELWRQGWGPRIETRPASSIFAGLSGGPAGR
jgi:N-acetylglucosamine malate deacetylase 2